MNKIFLKNGGFSVILMTGILLSSSAFAEKPAWAGQGGGKYKHHEKHDKNDSDWHSGEDSNDLNVHVDIHFGDHDRAVIHDYYEERYNTGHCPPGLAKKHNGCMPPGQAKKWRMGYPIPRDVIYHDLPPSVIVQIGLPPAGHKYVRVAADILLIAIGTGIVVDAIEDLGRI